MGNHDFLGDKDQFNKFIKTKGIFYIEKGFLKIESIRIASISGIIGKPDRINRVGMGDYHKLLEDMLKRKPDTLILHQTPSSPMDDLKGDDDIKRILESQNSTLVFCGHYHWDKPLSELKNGTQILSVDSRVVVLLNSKLKRKI